MWRYLKNSWHRIYITISFAMCSSNSLLLPTDILSHAYDLCGCHHSHRRYVSVNLLGFFHPVRLDSFFTHHSFLLPSGWSDTRKRRMWRWCVDLPFPDSSWLDSGKSFFHWTQRIDGKRRRLSKASELCVFHPLRSYWHFDYRVSVMPFTLFSNYSMTWHNKATVHIYI